MSDPIPQGGGHRHLRDQLAGLVVLAAGFALMALASVGFPIKARMYPLFVGTVGTVLSVLELAATLRRDREAPAVRTVRFLRNEVRDVLPYLAWLLAYLTVARLLGLVLASALFVTTFLRREGEVPWPLALAGGAGACLFLLVVGALFGLHWPESVFAPLGALGLL